MSFSNNEFCRIILNYGVKFEHEENACLFICIFKISPIETVELKINFDKKKLEENLQSAFGYRRTFEELYLV